jgi:ParB-like chromosome segregation protein Spo0J
MSQPNYQIQHLPIEQVKLNAANPRFIKDQEFKNLVKSLKDCPELFKARPLLCNSDLTILGGNMRYRAALELRYTEVPVIVMEGLTEAQERGIVIRDNGSFGSWDMDELSANWADLPLADWGVPIPANWLEEPEELSNYDEKEISEPLETQHKCPSCGFEY